MGREVTTNGDVLKLPKAVEKMALLLQTAIAGYDGLTETGWAGPA